MIGDVADVRSRLARLLPQSWFPEDAENRPVLEAILRGLATPSAHVYGLQDAVRAFTRIATTEGLYLDLAAGDFFGSRLRRRAGQSDAAFRAAMLATLFKEKATLAAVSSVVEELTGTIPTIYEPKKPATIPGSYTQVSTCIWISYDPNPSPHASVTAPYHAMVTVALGGIGIPNVAGYRDLTDGDTDGVTEGRYYDLDTPPADPGLSKYASLDEITAKLADSDVITALDDTRPAGTTLWVRFL